MATMLMTRQSTAAVRASRTAVPARSLRARMVVRASAEPPSTETPVEATFNAAPKVAPTPVAPASPKALSVGEAMAFAGPAPELINGRLAMVGVLAAIGAELATGESAVTQFAQAPAVVLTTWALIAVASLVPILKGAAKDEAFGPMTPNAEMTNGRFAMIGAAALLAVELIKGSALF